MRGKKTHTPEICGGSELLRPLSVSKFPWSALMMFHRHTIKPSPRPGGRRHTARIWQTSKVATVSTARAHSFPFLFSHRHKESLPTCFSLREAFEHTFFVCSTFFCTCLFFWKNKYHSFVLFKEGLVRQCWYGTNKPLYICHLLLLGGLVLSNFKVQNQFSFMFFHFSKPS